MANFAPQTGATFPTILQTTMSTSDDTAIQKTTGRDGGAPATSDSACSAFVSVVVSVSTIVGLCLLAVNVYALNKGFSVWDEAYYLLSYKMARFGFYRHFNNTPFVVAFLFERFNPELIGYRLIHLGMSIIGSALFASSVILFYKKSGHILNSLERTLLLSLTLVGAMYSFKLSVATLSYNHLNEFFVVVSQSLMLLAVVSESWNKRRIFLSLLSGAVLACDIYIKPPTFISILLLEVGFLLVCLTTTKKKTEYVLALLCGCVISFGLSLIFFYPPSQWIQYLTLMHTQQAHSPYKVLVAFLNGGLDMLKAGAAMIGCGLAVAAWVAVVRRAGASRRVSRIGGPIAAVILILNAYIAFHFFLPQDIWGSFKIHWWYWWVYSATALLVVAVVHFALGVATVAFDSHLRKNRLTIGLLLLLAATPIGISVGTLNGFGQVQMHTVAWFLMMGLVLIICRQVEARVATIYSAILILAFMTVGSLYFLRQEMPFNFSGGGALYEQKFSLQTLPLLHNVKVDKPTYDLLTQTKAILDKYPGLPTVVFFDTPGMQYAFGRDWVISDPWLTNYEEPMTKDDAYNCSAITGNPRLLKNTIFIVSNEKSIDPQLRRCLAKIGFPDGMDLLGTVHTTVGGMNEPIKIYLHP
jgi:branched-subunit amino acid transport protein AzlD